MNTEKPITEWLAELPDGYRERALAQYNGKQKTACDMSDAIQSFALWYKTIEGERFWIEVNNHYELGNKLPPLPSTTNDTLAKIRELEQRGESGIWQFPSEELIELANEIESLREKNADIKKDISNEIKRLEEIYGKY
jgi:hypothetical protein